MLKIFLPVFMLAGAGSDFSNPQGVWEFIVGEILFICFVSVLIYFLFIRPNRKAHRETADENRRTQMVDKILFQDGMVGTLTKYKDGIVIVESGILRTKPLDSIEEILEHPQPLKAAVYAVFRRGNGLLRMSLCAPEGASGRGLRAHPNATGKT